MNYFYITGASRGIGKAIAEKLLEDSFNQVIGISRSVSIEHERYQHIFLDLNDLQKVQLFEFHKHDNAGKIALLNNAGTVMPVNHVGKQPDQEIITSYNINLISPAILTNKFIGQYQGTKCEKVIINVSSGAGKYPVDGWSIYCSSKAGLDMHAKVVAEEQQQKDQQEFHAFAVAPGIVDTAMQTEIRSKSPEDFKRVKEFIKYKEEGALKDPHNAAKWYVEILNNPSSYKEVIISLKDLY